MSKLSKQYDSIATDFSNILQEGNKAGRKAFDKVIKNSLRGKKVLDLGCGDGFETIRYKEIFGAKEVVGLDASEEILKIAKKNYPALEFKLGLFESTGLNDSFDVILSKYAFQTSRDIQSIMEEAHRLLRPGGELIFLVTHPVRQYMEQKQNRDYFSKGIVDSICFDGQLIFKEPSHTIADYLSQYMFKHFILEAFHEEFEPAAEKIENSVYPGFLILKWRKN